MVQFTVRVELHEADWDDYEALNEEMAREGFERSITDSRGVSYELPTAEFCFSGDMTRDDVLNKAIAAAKRTGNPFSILVTKSAGRTWYGLR